MVRSFGQEPVVDLDAMPPPPAAGASAGQLHIDLVITPASLAAIEEQLAAAIERAVTAGFARAGDP